MANHSKPEITDNYVDVLSQVRGRFEDQAKGFDPANTSATNIQTNTIRWTSASNKWQKWNGTAWSDLSSLYAINISGNAGTVTNGVYTVGNQTIDGTKTFSGTIQGSISGNSGTVTSGVYTVGNQTIGGTKTFSNTIQGSISGNAATATNATNATNAGTVNNKVVDSGSYTATITSFLGNVAPVSPTSTMRWVRIGNIVHVTGVFKLEKNTSDFRSGLCHITLPFTTTDAQVSGTSDTDMVFSGTNGLFIASYSNMLGLPSQTTVATVSVRLSSGWSSYPPGEDPVFVSVSVNFTYHIL
jgi:hypothetical protein